MNTLFENTFRKEPLNNKYIKQDKTAEILLSSLFLLIQLTTFSETELLGQRNNNKSHMHKVRIMSLEGDSRYEKKESGVCWLFCALELSEWMLISGLE